MKCDDGGSVQPMCLRKWVTKDAVSAAVAFALYTI